MVKKRIATIILPSVCLLASFAVVVFLIVANWVKLPTENFKIWIKVGIPVNLLLAFACAAVVSSIIIGIFSKNAIRIMASAGISISIIMFILVVIGIYRRHGGNLSIEAASSNFQGIMFWVATFVAIVSVIVFVISLFVKKRRKEL